MKGHTSGLALSQFQPYYKLHSRFLRFRKPRLVILSTRGVMFNSYTPCLHLCGTLANSADPDQTTHNQGCVGSGSPLLFARNLNKKEKHQKHHPKSGDELVHKFKMGNSLRHVWVNIKCENE